MALLYLQFSLLLLYIFSFHTGEKRNSGLLIAGLSLTPREGIGIERWQ